MRSLLRGQRRQAIVPALRGFLAVPLDPACLDAVAAPTLVLTQPGDPLHPLRSGEILRNRLPRAELHVAPSATYWHDHPDRLAGIVATFVKHGRLPADEAAAGP